ncbi:putative dormancy/auxin associated protein [Lupinus albus]|uniref:Putative dormancy/auxin associated protein n=1 Tax=Lupinus albus TaxID=3870 RepID=A0A6A4NPP4_LUPAL|nr:putative dormancy/auxin associated protein [Lupinus albus]
MIHFSLQNLLLFTMGLLDHLWDDTVAGPPPENGLGKLRRQHTFAFRPASANGIQTEGGSMRSNGEDTTKDAVRVTRSIMILKPPGHLHSPTGSAPASPAGSTPPVSPFSGHRDPFRFRRRSTSDAYEKTGQNKLSPKSPFDV